MSVVWWGLLGRSHLCTACACSVCVRHLFALPLQQECCVVTACVLRSPAPQDELDEAARIGRKEQEYVADRAHAHADHLAHKVKH